MTVVITDTRTEVDPADTLTGWSSPVRGESLSLFASNPVPAELSNCIGMAVSEQTSDLVHTLAGATDLSDVLIYAWTLVQGTESDIATGGRAIVLLDATPDEIAYHLAGSDVAGFRHNDGPVGWQCLLMDVAVKVTTPGQHTEFAGTEAGLDQTNITGVGTYYDVASKALGGSENCFTDVIRYGNLGLVIAGGATGARGTFTEIATEDSSGVSGTAYGICHLVADGVFGLQGPLTFGLVATNAEHWFQDTNKTIVFEDRNIGTSRYFFDVVGNSTDTQHFQLGLIDGTTNGTDGCSIIVPAGIGGSMTMNDADLDFVGLYGSSFTGFDAGILFCDDATNGIAHDVFDCTFTLCGQINPGRVDFKNNAINLCPDASALLLEDSANTLISDISFLSDGTGHAIEITGGSTFTFTNYTYSSGYTGTSTNAAVFNDTGGAVTITIAGGDTPSVRNGVAASTTLIASVNVNIHVEDTAGVDIQNAQVSVHRATVVSETSGAGNTAGDGDLVITGTIPGSQGAAGFLTVLDFNFENSPQGYRYASHDGASTFTFATSVTGSTTSETPNSTDLISTSTNFLTADIEEGDTIRNTTSGDWAVVDEITDADNIVTSPLQGAGDNVWNTSDGFSVHDLATTLTSGADTVDMPLSNGQTDASGDAPTLAFDSSQAPLAVNIRVRYNSGATKYIPFKTSGTISATDGLTLNVVLQEDTVAT